jgi:hypothetical protein
MQSQRPAWVVSPEDHQERQRLGEKLPAITLWHTSHKRPNPVLGVLEPTRERP